MARDHPNAYQAWVLGEILLVGLLGAALGLFLTYPSLRDTYELPELRLVLDTSIVLAAGIVAVLAGIRVSVEGRRLDVLLCAGFALAADGTFAFAVAPVLAGRDAVGPVETWAAVGTRLTAAAILAAAPFVTGRATVRRRALYATLAAVGIGSSLLWLLARALVQTFPLPELESALLPVAVGAQALLSLVALVGFGLRFRARGEDLDRWLALAATLALFAELHHVFTPTLSSQLVSQGDFLRLLSYGVLLAGVWRAIRFAEFGRAVAEERARVAREIHDGLAQYLFAISTQARMLESGADPARTVPRLKEAADAAQQEARFAVLALSSASGNAPFDAALRRYVEFLTADGELEVELEIDRGLELAPDEQIEVFRIVQEGLGNVRKHARARRAEVRIAREGGDRLVLVRDDGEGFDGEPTAAGQGLRNLRARAASIGAVLRLDSRRGLGTALSVTLRA